MSVKLLKEAIELSNADDGVRAAVTKKKKKNARMMDTDLVTYATSSNYDPVEDVVLTEDVRVDKHVDYGRVMKTKNRVSKLSLLEESLSRRKKDQLRKNMKYMIYEKKRKLDRKKVEKILDYTFAPYRERRGLLQQLREQIDGVRDPKNTKKSKQSDSFFSEDDFLRIMPRPLQNKKRRKKMRH